MTTQLTAASLTNLATTEKAVDFDNYASTGGGFLPRIQLMGSQSKLVQQGKIAVGHYALIEGEQILDLGEDTDILALAVRDKAMDTGGEKPIAVFDRDSDVYRDIVHRHETVKRSNCMHGPSFLVIERTTGRFAELFLGNKTGRYEAETMKGFLAINETSAEELGIEPRGPLPCTLRIKFIEGTNNYHCPKAGRCSTPFDTLPELDAINEEVAKFVNPEVDENQPEVATEGRSR